MALPNEETTMKILFYKKGHLICSGDAVHFRADELIQLYKLGWRWEFQRQAL